MSVDKKSSNIFIEGLEIEELRISDFVTQEASKDGEVVAKVMSASCTTCVCTCSCIIP